MDLSGTDASLFTLTNSGELIFNAPPPNYEMPGDADEDNTYELTVGAKPTPTASAAPEDVEVKVTNMERGWDGDPVERSSLVLESR